MTATTETYTEEELNGLTEEERAALMEEDDADAGEESGEGELDQATDDDAGAADDSADGKPDADADDADGDDGEAEGEEGQGEDDAAADDDADQGEEGAEGEEADAEGDDGKQAARPEQPAPILTAEPPEDAEEKLTAIATAKDDLAGQFEDGELTAKEYQAELDKLAKQERDIERAVYEAELATKMATQQAQNAWLSTVNQFLDAHPRYRSSTLMYTALDTAVRTLAQDEANSGLSGTDILAKAHQQILDEFAIEDGDKPSDGEQPKGKKPAGKKPIKAPTTLAKVPASEITGTESTKWSKLDGLMDRDPERYEAELAKLSDADRDAYLAAQ